MAALINESTPPRRESGGEGFSAQPPRPGKPGGAWLNAVVGPLLPLWALLIAHPAGHDDHWLHLAIGRHIAEHGMMYADPFSFTFGGEHFVNWEWGAALVAHGIDALFGGPTMLESTGIAGGLLAMRGLLLSLAVAALVFQARYRPDGHPRRVPSGFVVVVVAAILLLCAPRLTERPHLFVFPALALAALLGERAVHHKGYALALVPLFALWANLHPSWPLGIAAVGAAHLNEWSRAEPRLGVAAWVWRIATDALWLLPAGGACLASPYIGQQGGRVVEVLDVYVNTEWMPLWIYLREHPVWPPPYVFLALGITLLIGRWRLGWRGGLGDLVLVAVTLAFGLVYVRGVSEGAMLFAAVAWRLADGWPRVAPTALVGDGAPVETPPSAPVEAQRVMGERWDETVDAQLSVPAEAQSVMTALDTSRIRWGVAVLAVGLLLASRLVQKEPLGGFFVDPAVVPVEAVAFMKAHGLGGTGERGRVMASDVVTHGLMLYMLAPSTTVYIDGRVPNLYPVSHLRTFWRTQREGELLLSEMDRYGAGAYLVTSCHPRHAPARAALAASPAWRRVYAERHRMLFVRESFAASRADHRPIRHLDPCDPALTAFERLMTLPEPEAPLLDDIGAWIKARPHDDFAPLLLGEACRRRPERFQEAVTRDWLRLLADFSPENARLKANVALCLKTAGQEAIRAPGLGTPSVDTPR